MYNRLVSGTVSSDAEAQEASRVFARYREYLGTLDLSRAGDLLLFFGRNFFHDAGIIGVELADDGRDLKLSLEAWPYYGEDADADLPVSIEFDVHFRDFATYEVRRTDGSLGLSDFRYGEIDGLTERISAAVGEFGGEFHSLTVECGGGWIAVVFRSAQVIPRDPILWARVMRSPGARLNLWGLD